MDAEWSQGGLVRGGTILRRVDPCADTGESQSQCFEQQADLKCLALQHGFSFHHANAELSVLLKWLPVEEPCQVPNFAHTTIGVGAMVVNKNKEILVVQEKYHTQASWKLPGGFVDPGSGIIATFKRPVKKHVCSVSGENLATAAQREVFEETGINTKFVSLVAFRHYQPIGANPRGKYGCSDIYFVAYLRSDGNDTINMCTRELKGACWMPVSSIVGTNYSRKDR